VTKKLNVTRVVAIRMHPRQHNAYVALMALRESRTTRRRKSLVIARRRL